MMRGPADLACSHCKQPGAPHTCGICKLQVCERCMDPLTCSEPVGRTFMLGRGARLRAVDPRGHHALVTQPFRGLLVLDLRNRRWLGEVPLPLHIGTNHLSLTDDGRVLFRQPQDGRKGRQYLAPVCMIDAVTGATLWQDDLDGPEPSLLGITPRQKYLWYTTGEMRGVHVVVWSPPHSLGRLTPLDRNPVTAVAIDEARDLIASGTSGMLAVHKIAKSGMAPALRGVIENTVAWLAFAGAHLFTIAAHGAGLHLERRELQTGLPLLRSAFIDGAFGCAAVSRDGTHIAIASGRTLHVFDVITEAPPQVFDEHTDAISHVAFAADHVLVSSDDDRRVILRPRGADGRYTRDLITQELPAP